MTPTSGAVTNLKEHSHTVISYHMLRLFYKSSRCKHTCENGHATHRSQLLWLTTARGCCLQLAGNIQRRFTKQGWLLPNTKGHKRETVDSWMLMYPCAALNCRTWNAHELVALWHWPQQHSKWSLNSSKLAGPKEFTAIHTNSSYVNITACRSHTETPWKRLQGNWWGNWAEKIIQVFVFATDIRRLLLLVSHK